MPHFPPFHPHSRLLAAAFVPFVAACAPEPPEVVNRQNVLDDSPTVFVVSNQKTTRDQIESEIDQLPVWLHSRYDSNTGKTVFAQATLQRALLFRAALRNNPPSTDAYKRFEINLLNWYLNQKSRLPIPSNDERVAFLREKTSKNQYDTRDIYVLYTATKSLADQIRNRLLSLPVPNRLNAFKLEADQYSLQKPALVGTLSRNDYQKRQQPPANSFLTPPPSTPPPLAGNLGPLDFDAPPGSITAATYDGVYWKFYYIGAWHIAADMVEKESDKLPIDSIDADIVKERRRELIRTVAAAK